MNKERHDILYSQARNLLNFNFKKLWFNIGPCIEKINKDEGELSNFKPRQSTILCENVQFTGWIDLELQAGKKGRPLNESHL
jgi:hypothetical protein